MTEYDHFFVGALVLLSVVLALGAAPKEATSGQRWSFYRQGWMTGIGLSALTLFLWRAAGRDIVDFGVGGWVGDRPTLAAAIGIAWAALLAIAIAFVRSGRAAARMQGIYSSYSALMPTSKSELIGSYGTAVAAGTGEEIAFRGFLLWYVAALTDPLVALLATSILFGIAHGYQKASGMIFASGAGLVLGTVYLASGSLLLVAWMHASWNVASFTMGKIVLFPATDGEPVRATDDPGPK